MHSMCASCICMCMCIYTSMIIYAYIYDVCVDHLYRCKTSLRFLSGFVIVHDFTFMQGAAGNVIVLQPTKTAMTFCDIDLGRWIDVPAINFPVNGNRLSQVPACRLVFPFLHNGQCCFRTFLRALFQTGFKPLYGFRNLIYCRLRQMEQLHLART